MLAEKELHNLKQLLTPHFALLRETATTITDQDISNYPVFVIFKTEQVSLGLPIIEGSASTEDWSVNASTLEELASKQIVSMENVERFTAVYKTHKNALCCLIYEASQAKFVFIPLEQA